MAERLGIVADDLTGAADTAGVFASAGIATAVSLSPSALLHDPGIEVLCIDTGTRYAAPGDAARRVREATHDFLAVGYSRLYKKIDSTLRGHVAVETAAMLDASGAPFAFVAPAFPATGRTQRDGSIFIDGVPLTETEEGRDLPGEASTSSIVVLLRKQTGLRCGLVPLADVDSGDASIVMRTRALLDEGCTIITFDAITDEHMRRIDAVLSASFPAGLPVGSAGLASAIARRVGGSPAQPAPPPAQGQVLVVSGSLNSVSCRQVLRAVARPEVHEIPMDTVALLDSPGGAGPELDRILFELQAALGRGLHPLLTWVGTPVGNTGDAHRERSRTLNEALSELMRRVGHSARTIGGLVLVGGDTTEAVLTGFGAQGISMRSEVIPGIPAGVVIGGDADSKPIVTKAGGFGTDDALLRAMAYLRGGPP